ncbi:hypothetical protein RZS08_65765, partial [Arthrospira platensis SPKY1]|nr:hypothetical protein [Arthrospira platensis SPKY1]
MVPETLRIGWFTDPVIGQTPPTKDVLQAIDATVALLGDLGHEVVAIPPPLDPRGVDAFDVIWWALADSVALPEQVETR